jgi:Flp pilus assembly protein TadD
MLHSNLGYSLYLQGNLAAAQAAFEESLRLEPGFRTSRSNLALVHARNGEYDKALRLLSENGNDAAGYNDLGYLCILLEEYDLAKEYLSQAMYLSPNYYDKAQKNLDLLEERMRNRSSSR